MKLAPYADKLREATGKSVKLEVGVWAHTHTPDNNADINLFFIPGLDGSDCSVERFTSQAVFEARVDEICNGSEEIDEITDAMEGRR